jgi:predicted dehydrogenase
LSNVGVAVVGLGWWGRHLAQRIGEAGVGLRVVATVDANPAIAADHTTLDEALARDDVDAVLLCTPNSTHHDDTLRCAAAGKHVLCEKPLALTPADARAMVGACRDADVVLWVGHERRYEPAWAALHRAVVDGELGTILHAEASFSHDKFRVLPTTHWRGSTAEAPAAGMTGMGIHLTDFLVWTLGPVARVTARVEQRVLPLATGDVVVAQLELASGALASISSLSVTPFYGRLAVFGSEAWTEVRDHSHPEEGGGADVVRGTRDGTRDTWVTEPFDPVTANLAAFAAAITGDGPRAFSDAELVHNIEVLDAIVRSAASGETIDLR